MVSPWSHMILTANLYIKTHTCPAAPARHALFYSMQSLPREIQAKIAMMLLRDNRAMYETDRAMYDAVAKVVLKYYEWQGCCSTCVFNYPHWENMAEGIVDENET
jgi:hypothetical protein